MRNALTGHSNAKAGSASSEGSACRFKGAPLKSRQDDRRGPKRAQGVTWRDSSSWPPSGTSR